MGNIKREKGFVGAAFLYIWTLSPTFAQEYFRTTMSANKSNKYKVKQKEVDKLEQIIVKSNVQKLVLLKLIDLIKKQPYK